MAAQSQSVYQRVIDKTKPVAFQSQLISQSVEKRLESQRQQQRQAVSRWRVRVGVGVWEEGWVRGGCEVCRRGVDVSCVGEGWV